MTKLLQKDDRMPEGMDSTNEFMRMSYHERKDRPPNRALVVADRDPRKPDPEMMVRVLDSIGPDFDYLEHVGMDEFKMELGDPPGPGYWIFEGHMCASGGGMFEDYDCWVEGEYRKLSEEEAEELEVNGEPWNPNDYGVPWKRRIHTPPELFVILRDLHDDVSDLLERRFAEYHRLVGKQVGDEAKKVRKQQESRAQMRFFEQASEFLNTVSKANTDSNMVRDAAVGLVSHVAELLWHRDSKMLF